LTEIVCVTDKNRKLQDAIKAVQEKEQQRDKVNCCCCCLFRIQYNNFMLRVCTCAYNTRGDSWVWLL